jgi:hypothetical protein
MEPEYVLRDDPRNMPSKEDIRLWWAKTSLWRLKGYCSPSYYLEDSRCFACGNTNDWFEQAPCQRAHIIPRCKGGSDGVDNLHMLCRICHRDSEGLEEPAKYWRWFFERTINDMSLVYMSRCGINITAFLRQIDSAALSDLLGRNVG